jgi:hypothetical protein
MSNILIVGFGTKEQNVRVLTQLGKFMVSRTANTWFSAARPEWASPDHATGVALIPRGLATSLANVSGYSKMDVKTFLWNQAKLPWSEAVATGLNVTVEGVKLPEGKDLSIAENPKQITFLVAGGDQSGHAYWMEVGHSNYTETSQEIKLPKNWDALLAQAEKDLGPVPVTH